MELTPQLKAIQATGQQFANPHDHVLLLNHENLPIGTADRNQVHCLTTPLHLAFSCYILNDAGQVLMTRRALSKRTWPGVWTNSCCGHPRAGEGFETAVRRRTREELGISLSGIDLALPNFSYSVSDSSGIYENEFCPVFIAKSNDPVAPNRSEVEEFTWLEWPTVIATARRAPQLISPWSALQIEQLAPIPPAIAADCQTSALSEY